MENINITTQMPTRINGLSPLSGNSKILAEKSTLTGSCGFPDIWRDLLEQSMEKAAENRCRIGFHWADGGGR